MTDSVDPLDSASPLPGRERRGRLADRPSADDGASNLPVPADAPAAEPEPPRSGFAAFAAQLLGGGQKRGLRGGPETLERARTAYLETEWSGPSDRRVRRGRITKTQI